MDVLPARFEIHGAMLALAWFLVVNIAATVAVSLAAHRLTASARARTAAVWFALRMFPAAAAITFVVAVFLPSYWLYEPRETTEGFDLTLTIGAVLSLAALVAAAARGVSAWRSASRRTRAWMRTARPLALGGTTLPAFEIDTDAPLLALVGVLRPRLLVTRGLIDALTPEELAAAIAHEIGHSHAWDNLKRLAMRSAPDLLPPTGGIRALERRWASSAEHHADHLASDHDPRARCALASALVKVARLFPPPVAASEPISVLVGGGDIASRVRRLLDDRTIAASNRAARTARSLGGVALVVATAAMYGPLLHAMHEATELVVRSLP
jgi:beta-lactamase regulating signal transducer with metallopeptidase domain